jgi:hypothetical protein
MSFKHLDLLDEVSYDELPENVQIKVDNFEKTLDEYEELDEDDDENEAEIRDLELKLESLDEGLFNDLTSFIQSREKEKENQSQQQQGGNSDDNNNGGDNNPPASDDTPSWRFW